MSRVLNFNPGPATLPLPALTAAHDELLDYRGTGMSIMEHSHRGKDYAEIHAETKTLLVELLGIPDTHTVLFMTGGASTQFALVPMNFMPKGRSADYIVTGTWSQKALAEAKVVGEARSAWDAPVQGRYNRVPTAADLMLASDAAYVHLTSNNTIMGTQFHDFPSTGNVPLVVDMSSDLLWRPLEVKRFGLIYAGAQKNLGPAGVTLVIVRKDWVEAARKDLPKIFQYATFVKGDSLQNTAPTFPIYMVRNVLRWVKDQGGAAAMEARNRKKADMLYAAMREHDDLYRCPVEEASRSVMNAVFTMPGEELEKKFLAGAAERKMVGLKGHRSVGGIRVSMYNALEPEAVEQLVSYMRDFARSQS